MNNKILIYNGHLASTSSSFLRSVSPRMATTSTVAKDPAHSSSRLSDWIPLDMKGKPLYAGINETERMAEIRKRINAVRVKWNDPAQRHDLSQKVESALKAYHFSRELRAALGTVLAPDRFWADQQDERSFVEDPLLGKRVAEENYGALEVYTTNDGYKHIFGYINQVFRKQEVDETEIQGAVALVELLTIDLYNFRLANFGCPIYYNFQGIVHRGLSVDQGVLDTFRRLLKEPLQKRNFSVPLAFVSTSASQQRIQEFLDKTEQGKFRLHWKIHIHELDPRLLAQYHAKYPNSIVSTICAMPISRASEFPNEQEILLRGPLFQIVRMYEEQSGDHTVHVVQMLMLNANRDHATELADHQGLNKQQRTHFAEICGATKYQICASLAEKYGLPEATEYRNLANNHLKKLSSDHIDAPFSPKLSESWSVPRPSWIGASLESSFTKYYAKRRATLSISSYEGKWDEIRKILDDEYDWQKSDWCNVPRLYGMKSSESYFTKLLSYHYLSLNRHQRRSCKR